MMMHRAVSQHLTLLRRWKGSGFRRWPGWLQQQRCPHAIEYNAPWACPAALEELRRDQDQDQDQPPRRGGEPKTSSRTELESLRLE